jgi:hypothetical protein
MATTKCINANAQKTKGNTSTIVMAGAVTDTAHINNLTVRTLSQNNLFNTVKEAVSANSSGNLGTIRPLNAGTFGYFARNKYVIRMVSSSISGVATTVLLGGTNKVQARNWNKIQTYRTSFLSALTWTANADGQPTYSATTTTSSLDFLADNATLNVGEFVYRTGKPLPLQADYQTPYSN